MTQHRLFATYMFYSTIHFRPIVFGRTSFYPPAVDYLAWQLREFPDQDSIGLLRELGVRTIVVHPELWPEAERGRRLAELRSTRELRLTSELPRLSGRDYERLGLGGELVYALTAEAPDAPEPPCTPGDEIEPNGWTIQGSGVGPADWAIDRDPLTKWKTDGQLPDDYLLLDLGRVETVAAVRLTFTYPYREFPRYLVLRGRRLDDRFETIEYRDDLATKVETLQALLHNPNDAAITLRFEPHDLQRLRIRVGGRKYDYALPDWGLPELFLYRSCD